VNSCEILDPRIRRTRLVLQQALDKLLEKKEFDRISVQDIAAAAGVNRATFYDHYDDKFALLECMVGTRFHGLLAERQVRFDGTCGSALKAMVLAVCEYLSRLRGVQEAAGSPRAWQPHMESAIVAVVRRILLEGLQKHPSGREIPPEMIAAAASWAIYGAAREWAQTAEGPASDEVADAVVMLVSPILHLSSQEPVPAHAR
jgi:AcrR family transcriptional regulator